MKKTLYIGLDPGKAGFFTLFDGKSFEFISMPYKKVESGQSNKNGSPKFDTIFDEAGFRKITLDVANTYRGYKFKAYVEDVGGRGGWSATNNFNFGYVAGLQRMVLIMLGAEITPVRPQKWQSFMRQGYDVPRKLSGSGKTRVIDAKAMAEVIVNTEYPQIDFRKTVRARKYDDNKVDSFLICMYGFRKNAPKL